MTSEFAKKGKFVMKTFSSDDVEWSSKNLWKMISAVVKNLIKTTRNKRYGQNLLSMTKGICRQSLTV